MKAPPPPLEISLHIATARILNDHCLPSWRWFHVPNGELRDIRTAVRLKRMGVKKGIADFILLTPNGTVRILELKRIGKKLTADQEDFRGFCVTCGIPFVVAYSIDDVLAAFNEWGCVNIVR